MSRSNARDRAAVLDRLEERAAAGSPRAARSLWNKVTWAEQPPWPTVTPKHDRPRCGARCRSGQPCQARAVWNRETNAPQNGRCRMHGGLPHSPEALAKMSEAAKARWARWRAEQRARIEGAT